jgi:hypothetical protein
MCAMIDRNLFDASDSASDEALMDWKGEWSEQLVLEWPQNPVVVDRYRSEQHDAWIHKELPREADILLSILRKEDKPLTKREIAALRHPKIFKMGPVSFEDAEGKTWKIDKLMQRCYEVKVATVLRDINYRIRKELNEIDQDKESKIKYLQSVCLAINAESISPSIKAHYLYHGPDKRQPQEILEEFILWAEKHELKNGQLRILAQNVYDSNVGLDESQLSNSSQLNNEDFPGLDNLLADDLASEV